MGGQQAAGFPHLKRYVLNGFQENLGEYTEGQDLTNTGCLL